MNEQTSNLVKRVDSEIVSICSCGRQYTALEFGALSLPFSGKDLQEMPDDGDPVRYYLYRNCTCGSTLLLPLDKNKRYLKETK